MKTRVRSNENKWEYLLDRDAIEALYPTEKMILLDGLCLSISFGQYSGNHDYRYCQFESPIPR